MILPPVLPGATIGIIGGGQLGRMLGLAAAKLGYRIAIYDPHERPCAAEVAAAFTRGRFDDSAALQSFADGCDLVTYEFENLDPVALAALGPKLRPGTKSLAVAQDRAEEKAFVEPASARVAPWRAVASLAEVEAAVAALGCPLVLKTRRLGYDGKGQAWILAPGDAAAAWAAIGQQPAVAEAGVDFAAEFSVILARTADGADAVFPVARNEHDSGILRRSTVPAGPRVAAQEAEAIATARAIAAALGHVGVLTVEFFAAANGPIVNEIAPRVHNSGHWTIEGAATSQFEQHVRAITGLPIGATHAHGPAVMENLIGDEVGDPVALAAREGWSLHLYGKGEARPGRKMGHRTRVGRA